MTPGEARIIQARLGVAPDGRFGPVSYSALFAHFGAPLAATLGAGAAQHFPAYQIDRPLRIAHWIAQFGHESSGFRLFIESLNYRSAARIREIWPSRFKTLAAAEPYVRSPEALANKVYGGRMGNDQPGDGWRYRGRGPQLTGADNYKACAARTGLDLVANPDLAAEPLHFVHIASDFWAQSACNPLADADDLVGITLRINGGRIGLNDRRALLAKTKRLLLP